VTSNPTIFQGAIVEGDAYDEQLPEVMQTESDPKEVFLALARDDIRGACDLFAPVFERGAENRDGWVSLEVDARGRASSSVRRRQEHGCSNRASGRLHERCR